MFPLHTNNIFSWSSADSRSRRSVLKGLGLFFAAGSLFPFPPRAHAESGKGKVLTVFFSKTGNTRAVAQQIHALVGGDMLELKTVHRYPDDHDATVRMAVQENKHKARPALDIPYVVNMESYSTIFAGYPVWEYTMPMAFFTFFEHYAFAGKTIIPFSTHLGSGLGHGPEDMAKLCPQARLLEGLAVRGPSAASAQTPVRQWVQSLGLVSS